MKRFLSKSGIMFHVVLMVLLIFGIGIIPLFAAATKPYRIELAKNWKLASSKAMLST
jgi:hypothetical protein